MKKVKLNKRKNLSLNQKYKKYLANGPEPESKLSKAYNLLDDTHSINQEMIIELQYICFKY